MVLANARSQTMAAYSNMEHGTHPEVACKPRLRLRNDHQSTQPSDRRPYGRHAPDFYPSMASAFAMLVRQEQAVL